MSDITKTKPAETEAPAPRNKSGGLLSRLSKGRATRPGETYGVPGYGDTMILSVVTIVLLIAIWWGVTALGLVKPLFVPSPVAIVAKFFDTMQNGF
ncbi:taurine ABC transporter permease, partial [Martelella sp. AMO21009]